LALALALASASKRGLSSSTWLGLRALFDEAVAAGWVAFMELDRCESMTGAPLPSLTELACLLDASCA
jgi:hypothetical protein